MLPFSAIYRKKLQPFHDKRSTSFLLATFSCYMALCSIAFFFIYRGPAIELSLAIFVYAVFVVTGFSFAAVSIIQNKRSPYPYFGIILNLIVAVGAFLLLIAVNISS